VTVGVCRANATTIWSPDKHEITRPPDHEMRRPRTGELIGRGPCTGRRVPAVGSWIRTGALVVSLSVLLTAVSTVRANEVSATLRTESADLIYNLDGEQAVAAARRAVQADPNDPAAARALATALWLSITYRRGNMTVDDFMGRVRRLPPVQAGAPSPETVAEFQKALDRAVALARGRIAANPKDADAHYQLGAALGLKASYAATVELSFVGAFRAAREAYDEHETVLRLDSGRKDAALVVGTYRYVVALLSPPLRWIAYVVGFGGDKDLGVRLVEEAAAYPGEDQTDARLALILMYNRERRYEDALKQLAMLRERYPRNRLVWLESGSTSLRAGRPADAKRFIEDGMARFAADARPRMFGEEALWQYKIGAARAALGETAGAQQALRRALSLEGRKWVQGRSHLELGKLELKSGQPIAAREHFRAAIALSESDNDALTGEQARSLMKQAG
jgi:tetratricopeptide (TPR) repeat protein